MFDRTCRHLWLADVFEDHGAEATMAALCEILASASPSIFAVGSPEPRYSTADLGAIEQRVNTVPRRSLQWSTAHEVCTAPVVAMTGRTRHAFGSAVLPGST